MNSVPWLILHPKAKRRIWKWVAEQKPLPSFQELTNSLSTRQDAQATVALCCHPLTLTHNRFPEPLPEWGGEMTCFGWNSMAKNLATCHSFWGRAINLTIVLVFCPCADCLGWEESGPNRRKWGFCK